MAGGVQEVDAQAAAGRVVRSGGKELALELEANGYADYRSQAA